MRSLNVQLPGDPRRKPAKKKDDPIRYAFAHFSFPKNQSVLFQSRILGSFFEWNGERQFVHLTLVILLTFHLPQNARRQGGERGIGADSRAEAGHCPRPSKASHTPGTRQHHRHHDNHDKDIDSNQASASPTTATITTRSSIDSRNTPTAATSRL